MRDTSCGVSGSLCRLLFQEGAGRGKHGNEHINRQEGFTLTAGRGLSFCSGGGQTGGGTACGVKEEQGEEARVGLGCGWEGSQGS